MKFTIAILLLALVLFEAGCALTFDGPGNSSLDDEQNQIDLDLSHQQ